MCGAAPRNRLDDTDGAGLQLAPSSRVRCHKFGDGRATYRLIGKSARCAKRKFSARLQLQVGAPDSTWNHGSRAWIASQSGSSARHSASARMRWRSRYRGLRAHLRPWWLDRLGTVKPACRKTQLANVELGVQRADVPMETLRRVGTGTDPAGRAPRSSAPIAKGARRTTSSPRQVGHPHMPHVVRQPFSVPVDSFQPPLARLLCRRPQPLCVE